MFILGQEEDHFASGSRRHSWRWIVVVRDGSDGGFTKMAVAHSGEKTMVSHHHSSQFQGNPIPYTIKPLTSPKNGTVSIERGTYQTKVFYQSKKGFVGQDSFQFVRVSDDKFAGTYTVAVTVK
jgi:hypothetical protein